MARDKKFDDWMVDAISNAVKSFGGGEFNATQVQERVEKSKPYQRSLAKNAGANGKLKGAYDQLLRLAIPYVVQHYRYEINGQAPNGEWKPLQLPLYPAFRFGGGWWRMHIENMGLREWRRFHTNVRRGLEFFAKNVEFVWWMETVYFKARPDVKIGDLDMQAVFEQYLQWKDQAPSARV